MPAVEYKTDDVLTAARKRVALIFDRFERVVVSVSGGKDSTVIRHLCLAEAERRRRKVDLFFLDQEAEYASTVDIMREWMADPRVRPLWYQVPLLLTNATSHRDYWLRAWWPDEEWLRPKEPGAIGDLGGEVGAPQRFYDFFPWLERRAEVSTAYVVGLRSRESFNRYRAVTKRSGCHGWSWSTVTPSPVAFRVYPIYDWTFGDVWKLIADEGLHYNAYYDRVYGLRGANARAMRVSNLIHEKSFRCLTDLHELEPDTYEALMRRLGGVHCAALYAKEPGVFDAKSLPADFSSWRAFRDYLLDTTPIDRIDRFRSRFSGQSDDEDTCREQAKQVLINDWENNLPVSSPRDTRRRRLRERWWNVL
ncbi:MAG: phosphoadenosine phosphosulfate reductase family protein [Gemmatimonadota bacterium]